MATIYDLSVSLRPDNMETTNLSLTPVSHEEAARIFAKRYGVKVTDIPHASFFSTERISLRSHLGTHLDAPIHFYPTSEGRPAKTIDEVPLEWCLADAVVLDFRHKKPSQAINETDIASELERIHYVPKKGDIVVLWTGGTDHYDNDPHFGESAAGMNSGALNYLFGLGVRIMATDSATIDMPIALMTERLLKGDQSAYFPIHRAGRLIEWTHAEKLANLASLPGPFGFKMMFFPVKISRGTGGWIRAVAIHDEWLNSHQIRLVDLSLPITNHSFEPEQSHIITMYRDQLLRAKARRLGIPVADINHAGATDDVETSTHAGTHIDAPYHVGPVYNGKRAATVDEVSLDWFYGDGVLLDFSEQKRPGETISTEDLRGQFDRIGYRLKNQDIVLIRTGAAAHFATDPAFPDLSLALERKAFSWLLDQGVRVIGCDAESLDGPVAPMLEALRAGRHGDFFPIHYAGREREFCLIHKMNLSGLPRPHGFKVAAFPVKLESCGAAWTRAVALVAV
ncbi:MAG: cyclase family protein [Nitrospirae bacterium]|nr:cyclase family protein [Nitrospirota bacterium]